MVNILRYCRAVWVALILLLIPFTALSDHNGVPHTSTQSVKLLLLGDSLSAAYGLTTDQGWVSLLQNKWNDAHTDIEIVNAAISGETSDGGLARLPRLLEQHKPSHLLIQLGGNDGLQGHNVNKLRNNLREMTSLAKSAGITVMIQEMYIPTNYGRRYNQMFTSSFSLVAEEKDVPLVPFFLTEIALNQDLMQRDGIHPNAEAQPMIAEIMRESLEPLLIE